MRGWAGLLALSASAFGASPGHTQAKVDHFSRMSLSALPRLPVGDDRKVALGRALFFDRRLSGTMTLSCASCHDLRTNGASGRPTDRGDPGRAARLNTPTIFNSRFSFRLGWSGWARSVQALTLATLRSSQMMNGGGIAAKRLAADSHTAARFSDIYDKAPDDAAIADALSAFVATLVTPDAPFDRWLRGEAGALTPQQVRGYDRFKTLGCSSCHQGVNVGANLFQRRGIFHPLRQPGPPYVRVPSLRNVAVTGPYFHDGSVASLAEAIRQMARAQLDLTISERDITDVSAFLGALTGSYQGHTLRPAPSASAGK